MVRSLEVAGEGSPGLPRERTEGRDTRALRELSAFRHPDVSVFVSWWESSYRPWERMTESDAKSAPDGFFAPRHDANANASICRLWQLSIKLAAGY